MVPSDSVSDELSSQSRFILAGGEAAGLGEVAPRVAPVATAVLPRRAGGTALSLPGFRRSGLARLLPCPLCLSHPRLSFPGSLPARPHLPGNGLMSHHLPGVTDYAAAPALPGSQGPPSPLRLLPLRWSKSQVFL